MIMNFEELDEITRRYMLTEFEAEELGDQPYRGKRLAALGLREFPGLMRQAIRSGNEQSLIVSLLNPSYWNPTEPYRRQGVQRERQINLQQVAESLGLTEFNTWYVRVFMIMFIGLSANLSVPVCLDQEMKGTDMRILLNGVSGP